MSVDPAVYNRDFLNCVDACHRLRGGEPVAWEMLLECLEKCWRRHARI